MSTVLTGKHPVPMSMWYAFRAGMHYERRMELIDAAGAAPRGSTKRRWMARYARRCNWEMLRLLRAAKAARAQGD